MTETTNNRESLFRALHQREGAFVIPNPWDVGSARILAFMGFEALATTSAGMAFGLGRQEGTVSLEDTLDHCRMLVDATPLPVSADLEKGFGDSANSVAETRRPQNRSSNHDRPGSVEPADPRSIDNPRAASLD